MPQFEMKNQTGYLFKNKYKTEDNHPIYKGTVKVNGASKEVAAWVATSRNGDKYMSLRFSDPVDRIPDQNGNFGPKKEEEFDDEIPF